MVAKSRKPSLPSSDSVDRIGPTNIPYKEIVRLYNRIMGKNFPTVFITPKRRQLIRAAWLAHKNRQSMDFWEGYFNDCKNSPLLNGTVHHCTEETNFEFLMRIEIADG